MTKKRLPRYGRIKIPPKMRLTERDIHILEAVHAYDGMLGFSQIQRLFFTGKSQTEQRLKLLYQHGYLDRPDRDQRSRMPEMIYWLDKKGAEIVGSKNSIPVGEFSWRKQPRWFQVEHDLAVNDFRLDMEEACQRDPEINLETWVSEREFCAYPDKIEYTVKDRTITRNIRPDGYFLLSTPQHYLRYLLEIDRSTEDNPRILREKIIPGLAYLKTEDYEERFGHRSGRWLVVTTGEKRLKNMLRQARRGKAKGLFYFTTYDQVSADTILHTPIWRRADRGEKVPLLFID